jgi:hypothetical protein
LSKDAACRREKCSLVYHGSQLDPSQYPKLTSSEAKLHATRFSTLMHSLHAPFVRTIIHEIVVALLLIWLSLLSCAPWPRIRPLPRGFIMVVTVARISCEHTPACNKRKGLLLHAECIFGWRADGGSRQRLHWSQQRVVTDLHEALDRTSAEVTRLCKCHVARHPSLAKHFTAFYAHHLKLSMFIVTKPKYF